MTGKEAGKPQIMPAFPQMSPFSWMFKMLVFFGQPGGSLC
jgi:hypothetical protein